ncbi:MAG: SpoIID/LytB domain-containing protein, partial [Bacteroidetes bacterium]|nr:SpoIID/LytB domain-containing protein [Bacteroidota bacterium]
MPLSCSRLLIASLFLALALPLRAQQADPIVRVYVLSRVAPQSITVRATDGPLTVYANRNGIPVHTLLPGETVTMDRVGNRVRITTPAGAIQASVGEIVPSSGSVVTLQTGTHRRVYHGALSVEIDNGRRAMRLINYVPLEDYVASVVASEYPFNELEGVKAQAILARTYALRAAGKHDAYDLVDDTRAQVYEGAEKETEVTRAATEATRGQVLTYRGSLVEALYSSSSGGHTASNEDIWNTRPVPYLRGRPDPYDSAAPDHRWST